MGADRRTGDRRRRSRRIQAPFRATLLVLAAPFVSTFGSLARVARDPETRNILTASGILLLSGMILFKFVEDLSWLDALYFSFITLSTIGYGDITPTTELGKTVTIVYSIAGLGILAALITAIASHPARRSSRGS